MQRQNRCGIFQYDTDTTITRPTAHAEQALVKLYRNKISKIVHVITARVAESLCLHAEGLATAHDRSQPFTQQLLRKGSGMSIEYLSNCDPSLGLETASLNAGPCGGPRLLDRSGESKLEFLFSSARSNLHKREEVVDL
ncbi:hypothetical protein J6590_031360 [Homalodisca vitripennis]|nr:hypothetical protein J6590_031360 [Homalodisca vitripennis]